MNGRGLKRDAQPMPGFVRRALDARKLLDAYLERPAYQRNDYLQWINTAKLDDTKRKRLDQMLDELEKGNLYMAMPWSPPPPVTT